MKKNQPPISATEVAKLLLSFDPDREYFRDGKMSNLGEEGYEPPTIGNFRLNKMLHICQMLHYAKYGEPLFWEDLRAYYHGAIVYPIYRDFFSFYRQSLTTEEILIAKNKKYNLLFFCTITYNRSRDLIFYSQHKVKQRPSCLNSKIYPDSFINTNCLIKVPLKVAKFLARNCQKIHPTCLDKEEFQEIIKLHEFVVEFQDILRVDIEIINFTEKHFIF